MKILNYSRNLWPLSIQSSLACHSDLRHPFFGDLQEPVTFTPTAERFAVEVSLPVSMTNSQVSRDSGSNLDFPHVYRSTNRAIVAQYTLKAEVEEKMKGTTATSEAN